MKRILIALVVALLAAVPVSAQTYLTITTTTAALNATTTDVPLTATTSVEANGALYIDHELMLVVSVNTTTKVARVIRSQRPAAHATAAVVYIATRAQKTTNFLTHQGAFRAGVCSSVASSTPATALVGLTLPIIDTDTGDIYGCRRNGSGGSWVWNMTNVVGINGAGSIPLAWP